MTAVLTKHYDLVLCNTPTTGTGSVTVGSAVAPYMNFDQAGVSSGDTISYSLIDVAGANSETGWGVATKSGSAWTVTRNVLQSTNSGSPISLSGSATISIDFIAQDFSAFALAAGTSQTLNTLLGTGASGSLSDTTSITSAYSVYEIIYAVTTNSGGDNLYLQFYDNGTLNTGSNYNSGWSWFNVHDNSSGNAEDYPGTSILLSNGVNYSACGSVTLFLPALSGALKQGLLRNVVNQAGPKLTQMLGSFQYIGSTNPLTGFKLFFGTGNMQTGSVALIRGVG